MAISSKIEINDDLKKELETYLAIKPYIGHCLSLNHEINNPLCGIIGYCELLLIDSAAFSEEHRDYLNKIVSCAKRVQQLVENLCEEKIALSEKIELKSVVDEYNEVAKKLD